MKITLLEESIIKEDYPTNFDFAYFKTLKTFIDRG